MLNKLASLVRKREQISFTSYFDLCSHFQVVRNLQHLVPQSTVDLNP